MGKRTFRKEHTTGSLNKLASIRISISEMSVPQMSERYSTLSEPVEGSYREKGSKFFAFAERVSSKEETEEKLERSRSERPDASHHCYAFTIGVSDPLQRENDDGEPSGTAGRPILNAIHSFGLQNVLVTVVRYFGGTKLGKRGLIDAYRAAAEDALRQGKIIEVRVLKWFRVEYPYESTGQVEALFRKHQVERGKAKYQELVTLLVGIPPSQKNTFLKEAKGFKEISIDQIEEES